MSLRNEVVQVIRLQLAQTEAWRESEGRSVEGERAFGTSQAVIDMLVAYCTGPENAVGRLADEIDALRAGESG